MSNINLLIIRQLPTNWLFKIDFLWLLSKYYPALTKNLDWSHFINKYQILHNLRKICFERRFCTFVSQQSLTYTKVLILMITWQLTWQRMMQTIQEHSMHSSVERIKLGRILSGKEIKHISVYLSTGNRRVGELFFQSNISSEWKIVFMSTYLFALKYVDFRWISRSCRMYTYVEIFHDCILHND